MKILIFVLIFVLSLGKCEENNSNSKSKYHTLKDSFVTYSKNFNRNFQYKFDENRHFEAFKDNYEMIQAHNQLYEDGKTSFRLGFNNMADLSNQRYLKYFVRLTKSERDPDDGNYANNSDDEQTQRRNLSPLLRNVDIPNRIDWRSKGFVTAIDNQGSCGSCYALSIVYSIEGQIFKRTGKIVPLSVQQLVDCTILTGNHGCSGGSLRNTLRYLELYGGIMREEDYAYHEKQGKCEFVKELSVVNVTSWSILPMNDEEALKIAVATIGPIAASINASPSTFQLYKEGIYDDDSCTSATINHAILIVGYTPDYWIIKNWWGKNWGEDGYIRMKKGKNMCGLARYAAYAIV